VLLLLHRCHTGWKAAASAVLLWLKLGLLFSLCVLVGTGCDDVTCNRPPAEASNGTHTDPVSRRR
jgi:hypothetical protein